MQRPAGGQYKLEVLPGLQYLLIFGMNAPGLARAALTLETEIEYEVTPNLAFISKSKTYPNTHPGVKTFNMMEMLAWIEARPSKLTPIDRQRVELRLQSISKNS
jgi:hypothetical protein